MKFTKMHGLGNDYVYMDCTKSGVPDNVSDLAQFVSNRHFGVGSDGLILICASDTCDFKMKMYNADGSEAQMCGNGIRCVGKFVYDKGLTNKTNITVETLAGVKVLQLNIKNGKVETVKVDMGEPILEAIKIPVIADEKEVVKNLKITALDKEFKFTCVSMGNPHAITIVEDVDSFDVEKYGSLLEIDKHFPEKANIEFIQIIDRNTVKMRVWERGSGETFACGTGACATTVACILNGFIEDEVTVKLLGGDLNIKWNKEDNHIYMTGPATTVFEGELEE
ncbi:MAG: diaminopimelate epimerase [Clostridia bacterium]|nr:diaminopimelate epimerase [Clostridia bacterium]